MLGLTGLGYNSLRVAPFFAPTSIFCTPEPAAMSCRYLIMHNLLNKICQTTAALNYTDFLLFEISINFIEE